MCGAGCAGREERSERGVRSGIVALGTLPVLAACGPSTTSPGREIEAAGPDGHDFDTEDTGAAAAPTEILMFGAVACAVVCVALVLLRGAQTQRSRGLSHLPSMRRASGLFRLPSMRRAQILVRHGPRPEGVAEEPGDGALRFPRWGPENRLVETLLRIANDPRSYRSGRRPSTPGVHVARARLHGPDGEEVTACVVVDLPTRDVLAAFPSRHDRSPDVVRDDPHADLRATIERARAALPESAASFARRNPGRPDSAGTLACVQELIDQREWEACVYALGTIAHDTGAGAACRAALDAAALALRFDPVQRARAYLV